MIKILKLQLRRDCTQCFKRNSNKRMTFLTKRLISGNRPNTWASALKNDDQNLDGSVVLLQTLKDIGSQRGWTKTILQNLIKMQQYEYEADSLQPQVQCKFCGEFPESLLICIYCQGFCSCLNCDKPCKRKHFLVQFQVQN